MPKTERDPSWLALSAILVVMLVFFLIDRSRIAIIIISIAILSFIMYFFSRKPKSKKKGG